MMKIYFTIFCFFFIFSASSQINMWKGFESPAKTPYNTLTKWGKKMVLTNLEQDSNSTVWINTYIWDGTTWDSLPDLETNISINTSSLSIFFYKNNLCYLTHYTSIYINGQQEKFAMWNGASWEKIVAGPYGFNSLYATADSFNIYVAEKTTGAQKDLKLYRYNDSGWTQINIPPLFYSGTNTELTNYKNHFYFIVDGFSDKRYSGKILKLNGNLFDTIVTEDSILDLSSSLYSTGKDLFLLSLNHGIYKYNDTFFVKTNTSDIPLCRYAYFVNSFFQYKDQVIGLVYVNCDWGDTITIRFDGNKWHTESDLFDPLNQYKNFYIDQSNVYCDDYNIIVASTDSIFLLPGKPAQYLGYIESPVLVKGKTYDDLDTTCTLSTYDKPLSGPRLFSKDFGNIYSDENGYFEDLLPMGQYTFKFNDFSNYRYWNASSCFSDSVVINISDSSKNYIYEFPIQKSLNKPDLATYITPYWGTIARRGFEESYTISCRNMGSVKEPAQLYIYYPQNLSNLHFDITPDTIKNNYACWLLDSMKPDSQVNINMTVEFDTAYFHLADSVYFYSAVFPENNDSFIYDNRDTVKQYIVASHDPNFKSAMPGDSSGNAVIEPGIKQLNYTIHFENTGTDTAYNVKIVDVLDTAINPFSIYTTSSSTEYIMSIYKNTLTWKFNNIKLPPKDTLNPNNHASEGYINYRVSLNEYYPIGTTIYNIADIYFDYNSAVQTNSSVVVVDKINTTQTSISYSSEKYNLLTVFPNPANDKLYISADNVKTIYIYNLLGELVYQSFFNSMKPVDISAFPKGLYLLKAENVLGEKSITKFVKE